MHNYGYIKKLTNTHFIVKVEDVYKKINGYFESCEFLNILIVLNKINVKKKLKKFNICKNL